MPHTPVQIAAHALMARFMLILLILPLSGLLVHVAGKARRRKAKGLGESADGGSTNHYPPVSGSALPLGNRGVPNRPDDPNVESRGLDEDSGPLDNASRGGPVATSDYDTAPLPLFWRFVSAFWADHLQEVAIGVFLCLLTACYRGLFSCCHRPRTDLPELSFQPSPLVPGVGPAGRGGTTVLLAKNPPRCPECGSRMILRTSDDAHHFFWGCAGFRRVRGGGLRVGSGHCTGTRDATVYSVLHVL